LTYLVEAHDRRVAGPSVHAIPLQRRIRPFRSQFDRNRRVELVKFQGDQRMSYHNQGTGAVSGAMGVGAAGGGIALSFLALLLYAYIALWPITVPATMLYLAYLAIFETATAWTYMSFVGAAIAQVLWFVWPVLKWFFAIAFGYIAVLHTMYLVMR